MADPEHLKILERGIGAWNHWRQYNPHIKLDLSGAEFPKADFSEADLRKVNLRGANLFAADLRKANLHSACLCEVIPREEDLRGIELFRRKASLCKADLRGADLTWANLSGVNLTGADICSTKLSNVILFTGKESSTTNFTFAKFNRKTSFLYVDITRTNWSKNPRLKRHIEEQQWLDAWRNQNKWTKYFLWPIWCVTCDCGRSLLLWTTWSVILAIGFACVFYFHLGQNALNIANLSWSLHTMIYYSIVTFTTLGFGDVTPKTIEAAYWIMSEVILGYIMLGGLISILATKLAKRA